MSITYKLYSIYDKVAGTFMAPTLYVSDELALRDVRFLVNNDAKFRASASDYELIRVGFFESGSGVVCDCDHFLVCNLRDLVEKGSE